MSTDPAVAVGALDALHDAGVLTDQEYEDAKGRLTPPAAGTEPDPEGSVAPVDERDASLGDEDDASRVDDSDVGPGLSPADAEHLDQGGQ